MKKKLRKVIKIYKTILICTSSSNLLFTMEALMKMYLSNINPNFIGVTGTKQQLDKLTKNHQLLTGGKTESSDINISWDK